MVSEHLHQGFFENHQEATTLNAAKVLGRATRTLIITPPHHENIHVSMNSLRVAEPLPLQPPLKDVERSIYDKILPQIDLEKWRLLESSRLMYLAAALIQFTDHMPSLVPHVRTSHARINDLHDEVVGRAAASGQPLSFPSQMEICLRQNDGDLQNSLWQLFITSRFYARRRDNNAIDGLPNTNNDQKLDSMVKWQNSLAACVPYSPESYQDAAGDTYYSWTHALAKVAFQASAKDPSSATKATARIFEQGTKIMQSYVNRVYPEGGGATARNHLTAANYGNAIGAVCVNVICNKKY